MKGLQYKREVIIVLAFCLLLQLVAISMNDVFVFSFFHTIFPLGFIAAAMWKEGRLYQ